MTDYRIEERTYSDAYGRQNARPSLIVTDGWFLYHPIWIDPDGAPT
jgi:hypothetical protein